MAGLIVGAVASKKAIEKVVEDLYDYVKSATGQKFNTWKTLRNIDSLYKKLKHIRFVKTIWQAEKEIDLAKFYYESKLLLDNNRVTIHQLADIPYAGNILIQGTVGQGKSIFLRYLVSVEMSKGGMLPVFVQLMRVGSGESLLDHVLRELRNLGLAMTTEVFEKVAASGKVILFLDAFDEIDENHQKNVLAELETLARQFDQLRIVVSSRPDRPIAFSPFFRVLQLAPLVGQEYEEVIRRMAQDDQTADGIIKGTRQSRTTVRGLLTTPLMIALLLVRYKIEQTIPENEIAFYEGLFILLLQRHDKSKAGYIRPRKSNLGDFTLQNIFNALCYLTRKNRTPFKMSALHSVARDAIDTVQVDGNSEKIIADFVGITCLIITEGDEWRFVHRSVQEYHAAVFISNQPDPLAIEFYRAMETRWPEWKQELSFLAALDSYRYKKHFMIPQLRAVLGAHAGIPAHEVPIRDEMILKALEDDDIDVTAVENGTRLTLSSWGHVSSGHRWPFAHKMGHGFWYVSDLMGTPYEPNRVGVPVGHHAFRDIVNKQGKDGLFITQAREWFDDLKKQLQNAENEVSHTEASKKLFEWP